MKDGILGKLNFEFLLYADQVRSSHLVGDTSFSISL